jgi:hypothetical protein
VNARRIVDGWLAWLRWSLCWDYDVARRHLERVAAERCRKELS